MGLRSAAIRDKIASRFEKLNRSAAIIEQDIKHIEPDIGTRDIIIQGIICHSTFIGRWRLAVTTSCVDRQFSVFFFLNIFQMIWVQVLQFIAVWDIQQTEIPSYFVNYLVLFMTNLSISGYCCLDSTMEASIHGYIPTYSDLSSYRSYSSAEENSSIFSNSPPYNTSLNPFNSTYLSSPWPMQNHTTDLRLRFEELSTENLYGDHHTIESHDNHLNHPLKIDYEPTKLKVNFWRAS